MNLFNEAVQLRLLYSQLKIDYLDIVFAKRVQIIKYQSFFTVNIVQQNKNLGY